jgi:hypothetical protein
MLLKSCFPCCLEPYCAGGATVDPDTEAESRLREEANVSVRRIPSLNPKP